MSKLDKYQYAVAARNFINKDKSLRISNASNLVSIVFELNDSFHEQRRILQDIVENILIKKLDEILSEAKIQLEKIIEERKLEARQEAIDFITVN